MSSKGVMNTAKGCKDHDLSQEAWVTVDGKSCYVQRTILFKPDSISYPEVYLSKLPCLVTIEQEYGKGPHAGEKMYPDLYVLKKYMILNKKLKPIQKRKCDGWIIPIRELQKYVG